MATQLQCDSCGELADMEMHGYEAPDGQRIEWPKASVHDGQVCFAITCPHCGARQQCISAAGDADTQ